MKKENMLEYFAGCWHTKKKLGNNVLGEGRANFVGDNNELCCQELFSYLNLPNVKAFRRDKYKYENGKITKYLYENNSYRLFYILCFRASNSIAKATYRCREDIYYATYLFDNAKTFTLNYLALGPYKKYEITTIFTRLK